MANLATLIRLHKHRVDEQRQEIARLQAIADEVVMRISLLDAELEQEMIAAGTDPAMALGFAGYLKTVKRKREMLTHALSTAEEQVEAARLVLQELFAELKRTEIAQAQRDAEDAAQRAKEETAELDEVGGQKHQRQKGR